MPDERVMTSEQQRLIAMLEYLEEWDKLNRVPTFDVASHQGGFLAWQRDLAGLPGIHLNLADASGEVWLEIERLRPQKPPAPSAELMPWAVLKDDPFASPEHRETLPNREDPKAPLVFDDLPEIRAAFESYMDGPWARWTVSEGPRRRSIGFYDRLFNLLQTIETEGAETALELAWGIGVAVWEHGGKRVRYPLVSRLVEIDPITTDMSLRIRPREVPPILETDVYVALDVPGLPIFEKAARIILDHPDSHLTPFDEASFEQLLAGAAGTLDRQARYWPREKDYEPGKIPVATDALTVTDAWVLFARRKGTNFLIEDLRRLRNAVESGPLPDSAAKVLVETPEGALPERESRVWRGLSSAGLPDLAESSLRGGELHFPKPFNAEQVQIIDRLENANGVVVQGPPGTGKTHTIANVICHYLAEGKRVLVTSKGESALSVLRKHLPAEIQSLSVSLLTSEREGLKQLEHSVSKITTEITNLNKTEVRRTIEQCQREIDRIHERIAGIDSELADWARKNIHPAPAELDGLRPADLARHVVTAEQEFGWFPDRLDEGAKHEMRFDSTDVERLREARSRVGSDLLYIDSALPAQEMLPSPAEIGDLHRALLELDCIREEIDERKVPRLRTIDVQHLASAAKLRDLLQDAARIRRSLSAGWANWLRTQFAARDAAQPVFAVVCQFWRELGSLIETRQQFLGVAIEWEDQWDSDEDLFAAIENAFGGKSPFGVLSFGKKIAKDRLQKITLNGSRPADAEGWQWIHGYATLRRQTRAVICRWNSLTSECPAPTLPVSPSDAWRSSEALLQKMADAHRWVNELAPSLAGEVEAVFADVRADSIVDEPDGMESLAAAIETHLRRHRLENARQESLRLKKLFAADPRPAFASGLEFVEKALGDETRETAEVEKLWQAVVDQFECLRSFAVDFAIITEVTASIAECGATKWANRLRTEVPSEDLTDWIPSNWASGWKWSRQCGYLRGIDGRDRMQALAAQRLNFQHDLANAYARLVEQLTWLKLRETLDQDRGLMSALQQYMAAIRGIGAGTGIRAVRFRQDARRAMSKANRAIRCWIMPHWRVSESLPSELALFDLVIVDEASQSDLWALPALLRAKKLLIVGDNKQVSPAAVGVRESDIRQLHARFLRTLPFGDVLTPEKSVYDLGSVMFASDLVRLREHFRCVEPIIEFSNRLCYNGEIKCLRVPTVAERITPPLVDVFVCGGYRDSRSTKINRIEAHAIVDEIKRLTSDPQFAGRSIGVVSLLGSEQARRIFEMLVTELGEERILRHNIRCGDAMTFQGREADIVFISMVSDAETVRALSGEMYEQRFNVAVSRAKDRLYLFRSFRREDLRENDLRARLLDHFAAPLHRDPEKKGRERCESDFERAVFDRLNAAGYRITPQVSVGGRRIDLVVEGHQGRRLAVECDGDQYHTPEVWMEDLHRQRALERAGWTFWRCWGSSFARDPEACMTDLSRKLSEMGIEAIGAAEIDLSEVVEYREVGNEQATADSGNTSNEAGNGASQEGVRGERVEASDFHRSTSANASRPSPRQDELLATESALPLWTSVPPPAEDSSAIKVGDSVRYVFVDAPDDEAFVTIVFYDSNPNLGLINAETAVARALLGREQGGESDVDLPGGRRRLRVTAVHKPRRA